VPLSALFLLMMGAGGFLVYAAVKNEHPWSMFSTTVGGATKAPASLAGIGPTTTAGSTVTVNPNTGTASVAGYPVKAQ
jgi:hypothetical protein